MDLFQFLFTLILTYQISQIISESTFPLFRFLRNVDQIDTNIFILQKLLSYIAQLFSCFLCTSVWIGIILSSKFYDISLNLGYNELSIMWSGLVYSCLAWFIHIWENK